MVIRLFVLLSFFALMYFVQRFWFRALWRVSGKLRSRGLRSAFRAVFVAAFSLLILRFVGALSGVSFLPHIGLVAFIVSLTQLWLFASLVAFVFFGSIKLIEYLWFGAKDLVTRVKPNEIDDRDRRAFFRTTARIAGAIPLIAGLYGFASERFNFRVRRVDVPIDRLPAGLDGLQIVQLSDIHSGEYMPLDEVRRAVNIANELDAHIAFVTGDFISSENDPLEGCVAELARLKAPLGIWGCNGNHEIYAHAEERAEELFRQHGMSLLRQQNRTIDFGGAKFNLIGVDYQRDRMVQGPRPPMLENIEPLIRRDMPNILLSHNPNSFPKAAELGIELSLAGHTHGGQVTVEILDKRYTPARFITPFTAGIYYLPPSGKSEASKTIGGLKRSVLYVNRGLGTFALPARIGVDPEITLLRLRRA